MESVKDKIKQAISNKTYVAIKDTYTSNVQGKPTKQTKYRIVELDTYKRLAKGVKIRLNKDTKKLEEYIDKNPHKVQELGRSQSKEEAKKCVTFTSNSGPMFIIGSVGVGMLNNRVCGYIILLSHIIGSVINGLIYRNIKITENNTKNSKNYIKNNNFSLSNSILDSISSILLIGGIMIIAFIIIEIVENFNLFLPIINLLKKCGISSQISSSFLSGIFEMTKGCLGISSTTISLKLKTILSCSLITFGGLSTSLQAMAFLKEICSYKFFITQKITHMLLSTCICVILCFLFSI